MRRAAYVLALACGGGGGSRPGPEADIAKDLAAQLGAPVAGVTCPPGAHPKQCTADVDGAPLTLTVREDGGELAWDLDGLVISTKPLAAAIAAELDDLGLTLGVDCGATYRVTHVGDRFQCGLAGGGAAFVTITDDDAHFHLELALDPAAVTARTAAADPAQLEQMSRALDRDDQAAGGDDEPDDNGDAGVAP